MANQELIVGMPAPPFTLPSQQEISISSADFLGQRIVLYFYPKDGTLGCTKEACAFRDGSHELQKYGAVVLGISMDTPASHRHFQEQHHLNFYLLSDPKGEIIDAYGAWNCLHIFGKRAMAIQRCTFVIDEKGILRRIWRRVKTKDHVSEVLAFLEALQGLEISRSSHTLFSPRTIG